MQPLTHIDLLGGLAVRQGGKTIGRFATRKSAALLAYLAYHIGRRHSREELSERLWPEAPPDVSRHRLRQALTSLRRQVGAPGSASCGVLEADRSFVGICVGGVEVDTDRFWALLEDARNQRDPCEQRGLLAGAAALYRGELLPGFYDDWILSERERLALAFLDASCRLALLLEGQGDMAGALDVLYRALACDPLHEDAHIILIRFHAAMGRAGAARAQFATLERLLAEQMGIAPDDATREMVARLPISAVRPAPHKSSPLLLPPFGAAPAPSTPRADRWVYITRFFGRDAELRGIRTMLAPGGSGQPACRLLSLVGGGGCGKTRLAVEAANELRPAFGGRVWIVPLADIKEPSSVAAAIADAVGLDRVNDQDPMGLLAHGLGSAGPSLVVLDNAEQLVPDIADTIGEVLALLPDLACLVTSRRAMGLAGERVLAVAPLPVPGADAPCGVASDCASVQLLVDRIQARRPDFQVTHANSRDVAALCSHLEGVPLAIELATAWSVSLTPRQMLHQMRRRLDIGRPGRPAGHERHRSLRATLEWSRRLLAPDEQTLFARLSVFSGGCSLEAANAVCSGAEPASDDITALNNLVDLSLLTAEERDGEMRYRMPEIVREYACELLGEAQALSLAERHADWFARVADDAYRGMRGTDQIVWLRRLDADRDNLDVALEWSIEARDGCKALRIVGAIAPHWDVRGRFQEGYDKLRRAILLDGGAAPVRARALMGLAAMASGLGRADEARIAAAEAVALLADRPEVDKADAYVRRAYVEWLDRCVGEAERWFVAALEAGDPSARQAARLGLGKIALHRNHLDDARGHQCASVSMARATGAPLGLLVALIDAGVTAWFQRDLGAAEEMLAEGLAVCRQADDRLNTIRALWGLGNAARSRGDIAHAAGLYAECLEVAGLAGARWCEPYMWEAAAHLHALTCRPREATQLFGASSALRNREEAARLLPAEVIELEQVRQSLEADLGAGAFAEAWSAGCAMSPTAAVELAARTFAAMRWP